MPYAVAVTLGIDHGYAFSGEAGNAPEIVDKLLTQSTRLMSFQKLNTMAGKNF
jgi:hypothetical protein